MSVTNIPQKVRYLLWAKSAGRCHLCNRPLWRDDHMQIELPFGQVAHIIGDRPGGPRGDLVLSPAYCKDINNLMLLCPEHHKTIDELYETFTDDDLRLLKTEHEIRIEQATSILPNKKSHVLIYRGNVGQHKPKIDISDAMVAMYPDWYPVSRYPVYLGMDNTSLFDNEDEYWMHEEQNLVRQFNQKVIPLLEEPERNHFSIFAFAPQPLLIKLGTLIPDLFPGIVYQPHRDTTTSVSPWRWQPEPTDFDYWYEPPASKAPIAVLNLSLSAEIIDDRIHRVMSGQDYSIWHFSRTPFDGADTDFLKGPDQTALFRKRFRQLLDDIKNFHGESAEIHVFPIVPAAIAVDIGRVWQSKADLPMVIYDQNRLRNGFIRTLSIGM